MVLARRANGHNYLLIFISSTPFSIRASVLGAGALLLWEKKIPPPPLGSGGSETEKYTLTPCVARRKTTAPGVRDTHTPAGMGTLTTTGALPTDTPTKEDEADHGTLIAVAIHQANGMEPRQEAQGTLPHMRRTNRLLCSAVFNA